MSLYDGYAPSFARRRPSTMSMISSETAWPIKLKLLAEHSFEKETEVSIKGPGHMTKMADMAIK